MVRVGLTKYQWEIFSYPVYICPN